jgi:hypothetical protein
LFAALVVDGACAGGRLVGNKDGREFSVLEQEAFLHECLAIQMRANHLSIIVDAAGLSGKGPGKINGGKDSGSEHEPVLLTVLVAKRSSEHSGIIDAFRPAYG